MRTWQQMAADYAALCTTDDDDDTFVDRLVELLEEAEALPFNERCLLAGTVMIRAAAMQDQILRDHPNLALKLQLARQLDAGGNN